MANPTGLGGLLGAYASEDEGSSPSGAEREPRSASPSADLGGAPASKENGVSHAPGAGAPMEVDAERGAAHMDSGPAADQGGRSSELPREGGLRGDGDAGPPPAAPDASQQESGPFAFLPAALRAAPPGEPSEQAQELVSRVLAERAQGLPALNERLRQRREVRDPGLLTQLAKEFAVEQYQYRHGVPGDVWDPEGFDPRLSLAGLIEEEREWRAAEERKRAEAVEKKKEAAKAATVAATPGLALNAHNLRAIEEAKEKARQIAKEQAQVAQRLKAQ